MKSFKWVLFVLCTMVVSPQVMAAEQSNYKDMGAGAFRCGEQGLKQVAAAADLSVENAVKKAGSTEEASK